MSSRWLALALLSLVCTACPPEDASEGECGSDQLAFGTAIGGNGFDLVGQGTTFSLAETEGSLAFRVKSDEDMGGRAVRLYVYDAASAQGDPGVPYAQTDFPAAQDYGCQLLSTIRITDPGVYEVRAYLVAAEGSESLVTTSTVELIP